MLELFYSFKQRTLDAGEFFKFRKAIEKLIDKDDAVIIKKENETVSITFTIENAFKEPSILFYLGISVEEVRRRFDK